MVWSDRQDRVPGAAATSFPPGSRSGAAASLLVMDGSQGQALQPFRCRLGTTEATVSYTVSDSPVANLPPTITLYPPSREEFQGPYRNATLLCHIQSPSSPHIRWLRNGQDLHHDDGSVTTQTMAKRDLVVTNSLLVVTEAEWASGAVFTCQVDGEMRNISKALECGYEPRSEELTVTVTPPAFADLFKEKVAKLRCRVLHVPSVDGLDLAWWREDGSELPTERLPPVLEPNGLFRADAVASVSPMEWGRGDLFTCRVSHPDLLFPAQASLRKEPVTDARAPSMFVFPPAPEQLSVREWATLTCLVTGFNPPDLFIQWLRNGEPTPASQAVTFPPAPEPEPEAEAAAAPEPRAGQGRRAVPYLTYSALTVPARDWAAGNVFTCLAGHERLPMQVMQRSLDKASGKATAVNVSLVLADAAAAACY